MALECSYQRCGAAACACEQSGAPYSRRNRSASSWQHMHSCPEASSDSATRVRECTAAVSIVQ
eukprot:7304582-Prymnesium_polylepis.1